MPFVRCSPRQVQLLTLIIAAISIVAVLMILFMFNYPTFVRQRIIDAVVFKNDSMEMERFKNTNDLKNLRLSIYVFNVTNADEVIKSSAKVNLEEIGPFVYHEYKEKEIIDNDEVSGLITYKLRRRYTFLRNVSIGDPSQMNLVWPNVPLIAARALIDNLPFYERGLAYALINRAIKNDKEPAFMVDTVENLLFDGSKRELFEDLQAELGAFFKPWPLKDNKFGVFYDKNFTWYPERDHTFTVSAGFGGNQTYRDLNKYVYMNQSSTLPYWGKEPPNCNQVGGTDGEFFSPFLNSSQNLEAYATDICRKVSLKFRQYYYLNGVRVLKYTMDEKCLQSGDKNPENVCYCLAKDSNGQPLPECRLDGLMDMSTCVAPNVVASGAHFIHGSPELLNRVSGLTPPNESIHDPYIYVEPNTGITIQVSVPIQLNVRLEKGGFDIFEFFKDEEPLILPLLYVDEAADLTEDQASLLRTKLLLLDSWLISMVLGGAIVLILAIVAAVVILCTRYRSTSASTRNEPSETDPLLPPSSPSQQSA